MNIKILQLIEGAKQATGLTVVIDVFRAFSVEAYLADLGVRKICPVADKDVAYDLKKKDTSLLLVGERKGAKLPGFDFGNSPSQILSSGVDFKNKTIIHTTSAGTQGIANATGATEILTGSLVNASAIARYIKQSGANDISLVCMGLRAERPIEEDTLCANYIKSLLEDKPFDLAPEIEKLKSTSGEKFFDPEQQEVFPEQDFHLCVEANKFNFVLKVKKDENGNDYVEKIDV